MNKKIIIPVVIVVAITILAIITCRGDRKILLQWDKVPTSKLSNDSIELRVYVENSGSMDAYMCSGSNLKDAVFDYVSDLRKLSTSCNLYYINSKEIPYNGNLQSFIKDLTPQSFAEAGGNRSNTDLRSIFQTVLNNHNNKSVTIFVSDCILDIYDNATDFFGNCQVSIKNIFNDAISKNPNLGVQILKMESKFDGFWYCGKNFKKLSKAKRPYYIWIIGDKKLLAKLNKLVPVNDIYGGIKEYCAFSGKQAIPFDMEHNTYIVNHTRKINIQILANLNESLQSDLIIKNINQYKSSNPTQTSIVSVEKIVDPSNQYSHVIKICISNPGTVKEETITFSYPYLASWVQSSNDDTGIFDKKSKDKTTGILHLIKGVAEAYKTSTDFGSITFSIKNK